VSKTQAIITTVDMLEGLKPQSISVWSCWNKEIQRFGAKHLLKVANETLVKWKPVGLKEMNFIEFLA
jgi:hypothetical protein